MCFFPQYIINKKIGKYSYYIETECGGCPECSSKKSRLWSLRCSMEAKTSIGFMCTLTYDEFERDKNGRIIGEKKKDYSSMTVSKRDCQLFVKRLRKYFFGSEKSNLKYMICAEYGKRTGRPHYHAIIFGIHFDDLIPYKKSKRGNQIYMSSTLTKIWNNGICTIDSVQLNSAIAQYCTKYCAKDSGRASDTFMLFSHGIGREQLLKEFNGKSYILEGREYPIPRFIWHEVISNRYNVDFRYTNKPKDDIAFVRGYYNFLHPSFCPRFVSSRRVVNFDLLSRYYNSLDIVNSYHQSVENRKYALYKKHCDIQYREYLAYWEKIAKRSEVIRPKAVDRILSLDNEKYFGYKQFALLALDSYKRGRPVVPPRSNSVSYSAHEEEKRFRRVSVGRLLSQKSGLRVYYQTPFAVPPLVYKRQMTPRKQTFMEKVIEKQKNIKNTPLKCLQNPFELMYNNYARQINIFEV